jgi:predicted TIM-barrel fold metal-dependent hydrolase
MDVSREEALRVWLSLSSEPALEPELPFIDCHHHLMDHREPLGTLRPIAEARPAAFRFFLGDTTPMYGCRYLAQEYGEDMHASGHRVSQTVYVEAGANYDTAAPAALQPVGETRFAQAVADASQGERTQLCAGIVAHADLGLGREVAAVLDAHREAAPHTLRGVRHSVQWDPSPELQFRADAAPRRLYDGQFREGLQTLARRGLSYDVSLFHHQLLDLADAATALPELRVVLNHCGHALGVGLAVGESVIKC